MLLIYLLLQTGASVHACRRTGHHLVALESNGDIFRAISAPLAAVETKDASLTKKRKATAFLDALEVQSPVKKRVPKKCSCE
jgi:hypothetical protein